MGEVIKRTKHGNPWLSWILLIFVLLVLMAIAKPVSSGCGKSASLSMAISNAKQAFYLLVDFDQDFGQFPNDATAAADLDLKGYRGEFSNDYLAQFIAGGYTASEDIFYAKGGSGSKKRPDNLINHRENQLSEGECGFAYIKDLSTKSPSDTPILLTPMYGDGYKFNTDVHQGKAVVLRVDGAVKALRINKEGNAYIGGGKTLFDAGADTVWGEEGFESSKLCYAKKPYHFTPSLVPVIQTKDWIFGGLSVLLVVFIIGAICHSCKRCKMTSR